MIFGKCPQIVFLTHFTFIVPYDENVVFAKRVLMLWLFTLLIWFKHVNNLFQNFTFRNICLQCFYSLSIEFPPGSYPDIPIIRFLPKLGSCIQSFLLLWLHLSSQLRQMKETDSRNKLASLWRCVGCSLTLHPKGAQKTSNWHISPKCWQHISNTNIYITKCTFPYPAPQRAHRKPPTDIYPPNVGRIYPIQIYILQHVHSLTLGPKGRTENLQLTYFPKMLAANIQ